jgi:hypothetical protein
MESGLIVWRRESKEGLKVEKLKCFKVENALRGERREARKERREARNEKKEPRIINGFAFSIRIKNIL